MVTFVVSGKRSRFPIPNFFVLKERSNRTERLSVELVASNLPLKLLGVSIGVEDSCAKKLEEGVNLCLIVNGENKDKEGRVDVWKGKG